jgi:predicted enzyme related to lactoylglutathione lyase
MNKTERIFPEGSSVDLYAVIPVNDYVAALTWYERLFGCPPTFIADDTEAVWELAEHRSVAIEQLPEHAGHGVQTIFIDSFTDFTSEITKRGLEPVKRETYGNGVRKAIYRDPEGNEIGFGGAPV